MMDTKKLVVGQDVYMFNGVEIRGIYFFNGKVVKVTPKGVEVEATDPFGGSHNLIWRFDTQGKSNDHRGTAECGPWLIDTLPFEDRKVEIEESKRREERRLELWNKVYSKLVVGHEVFVASGIYYVNGKVTKVAPEGVEVFVPKSNSVRGTDQVWRFDTQGKTSDGAGGTAEYGPWVMDDMPFEERKAQLERNGRKYRGFTPASWEDNLCWCQ